MHPVMGPALAGLALATAGCAERPMAVTVGHSPIAYTDSKAVTPMLVPVIPVVPMLAPVPSAGRLAPPSPTAGPAGSVPGGGVPCAPGAPAAAQCDDPVVTVPAYTLPVYAAVGPRTGSRSGPGR